jgi:large subunit ribosomal protein L24
MAKIKLRKGDLVRVISGNSRSTKNRVVEGKIISIDLKKMRAIVEGVNMISKSEKPNAKNTNGGIVKKEGSIHVSNLMLVEAGKTIRVGRKVNEETKKLERVSRKTKEVIK